MIGPCPPTPIAPNGPRAVANTRLGVWNSPATSATPPPRHMPSKTSSAKSATASPSASPDLHSRLSVEAAEQGVSLNQWAITKLAGRLPSLDDLF
ncbi:DNA repair protein [Mycolicibacterium monacense DSM 44395]|nr:DNA repair protein HhH-GPD [Mycolicibacterium monacense DSM 44395]ORB18916.1 DNA repair protein [Mycolicibacterium monacense DSM 44395]QHP87813.1 toxin-antitoxin system HicB family antitoxin [Mycolicibacterium monacense DSM 44395]